jgi:hypothetical protein
VLPALTEREIHVLRLMASGYSNREIGAALEVSEGTIKNHVSSILARLGVHALVRHLRSPRRWSKSAYPQSLAAARRGADAAGPRPAVPRGARTGATRVTSCSVWKVNYGRNFQTAAHLSSPRVSVTRLPIIRNPIDHRPELAPSSLLLTNCGI